jgi:glucosamine kinase
LLGQGTGGPANPVNGLELTQRSIMQSINQAIGAAGIECANKQLTVGAGLAGLHLPALRQKMHEWQHPFNSLYLTTDVHAAVLGAHTGQDGAVIVLGTGFSALGTINNNPISIGGYGFPINANCSGAWFGLEMIKAVLLDADQIGPQTSMTQAVLAEEDIINIATRLNNAPPFEFAKYAPIVFEHANNRDQVAMALVKQGAEFINTVMDKFVSQGIQRISFVGGIAPDIMSWLAPKFEMYIVSVQDSPEHGAVLFAKQQETLNLVEKTY